MVLALLCSNSAVCNMQQRGLRIWSPQLSHFLWALHAHMNLVSMHILAQSALMRNVTSRSKVHWKSLWTRQVCRAQCAVMQVCQHIRVVKSYSYATFSGSPLIAVALPIVSFTRPLSGSPTIMVSPEPVSKPAWGCRSVTGVSLISAQASLTTECAPHILPTAVLEMHANTHYSGPQNPRLALKNIVSVSSCIGEHASGTVVATCMRRYG